MPTSDHRLFRSALIPWVIALVVLFVWNAFGVDHPSARKSRTAGDVELSQQANDVPLPGRQTDPLEYLAPPPCGGAKFLTTAGLLLRLEIRRDQAPTPSAAGAVHGRGPPAKPLA